MNSRSIRKHFHIDKKYLLLEYVSKNRSANDIAIENRVKANLIIKRLKRFNIEPRSIKEANSSDEVTKKRRKSCIEKYGVDNVSKDKEIIKKIKDNTDYEAMGKKISRILKNKPKEFWLSIEKKRARTMLLKYGISNSARFAHVRKKMRIKKIEQIRINKFNGYQWYPAYNSEACQLIDEYGKQNNYDFQHAMNGGEFHIKELGYWVDGYDDRRNTVVEVDEMHHFDSHGNLKLNDIMRQKEITEYLKCKFIRLKFL